MTNRTRLSRPPRVLIASDQNHGLRRLEGFLGQHGYSILRLYAGGPVLERARDVEPDVIVLDARIADRDGLTLSRALRDDPNIGPSTPILLMTPGHPTPSDHLAALRAGIWELLPLPLNHDELLLALDGYVRARLEAERAPTEKVVDDLTGLYTAQGLARRARELISQASHHNTAAACVVFAPALEAGGEPSADLLQLVGRAFHAGGRRSDAIGRVGQGEFAVVAPGTDAVGAVKLAERFRRAVPTSELRAGYEAVGNVRYRPVEPNDLLAHAARALQLAKAEGKWIRAYG
jgi:PleD family two-component response regulator